MIQMYRADLPLEVPCMVVRDDDDVAIIVNANFLGGDTAQMREYVNVTLATACGGGHRPAVAAV